VPVRAAKAEKRVPGVLENRTKYLILKEYIALCGQTLVAPLTKLAGKS
jgi:hypothetical protein